jgi:hypothetical protein
MSKLSISRPWRFKKIHEIISGDVIDGNISLQNYSVIGIQKHVGVRIFCSKCNALFTFSAKEQQFWYEQLRFWADSVPVDCLDCRGISRNIVILNKRLSKVLSVKSLQMADYDEIVDIASGFLGNGVVLGGRLAQKITMAAKRSSRPDAKKILERLRDKKSGE